MQVGQIFEHTLSNVPKIHDPSTLRVKRGKKRKNDTQTKMVSCDLEETG